MIKSWEPYCKLLNDGRQIWLNHGEMERCMCVCVCACHCVWTGLRQVEVVFWYLHTMSCTGWWCIPSKVVILQCMIPHGYAVHLLMFEPWCSVMASLFLTSVYAIPGQQKCPSQRLRDVDHGSTWPGPVAERTPISAPWQMLLSIGQLLACPPLVVESSLPGWGFHYG